MLSPLAAHFDENVLGWGIYQCPSLTSSLFYTQSYEPRKLSRQAGWIHHTWEFNLKVVIIGCLLDTLTEGAHNANPNS